MSDKVSKESVHYTDHASDPHERCGRCQHFMPLYQKCEVVKGSVNPRGWCNRFERKEKRNA